MANHPAKYPQAKYEYDTAKLTKRQAARLAALADVSESAVAGLTLRDLRARPELAIEPSWLFGRKVCGRVVKKDADGNNLPVPFATVNVYDTDITGAFWSPGGRSESWFYPLNIKKEKIASVKTDECGRFCIRIPWFDIDWILRFRLERHCYLEWFRKPTIRDILERHRIAPPIGPDPDPAPLRLDEHTLRHAARVLDGKQVEGLRKLAAAAVPGASTSAAASAIGSLRWSPGKPAPMTKALRRSLLSDNREQFRALTGLPEKLAQAFNPRLAYGPFLRCHWHFVPEWHPVIDVPDITFEATQDVNGDGTQDVIYAEGLFDVRWNSGSIPEVELVAGPNAIASATCDNPILGPCGDPAILFAGNYELQQPGNPMNGHDRNSGYALFPNVPRTYAGLPGVNPLPAGASFTRAETGKAPFRSNFYLWGCCERPGAKYYRITYKFHPSAPGAVVDGVLSGASWRLAKLVGGTVQYLTVSDVGGWYPIVPRSDGWTPSGLLALVPGGLQTGRYVFKLEFGNDAGSSIAPIANSATEGYAIMIDDTAPEIPGITQVRVRQGGVGSFGPPLPMGDCPVVVRNGAQSLEFELTFSTAAFHLRDVTLSASGCGPAATPTVSGPVISPDTYVRLGDSGIHHWHLDPEDNETNGTAVFLLPANAPAGCYNFDFTAYSRAIDCNQPLNNSANNFWHDDQGVIHSHQRVTISIQ